MLDQTTGLVRGLVVDAVRMRENLELTGGLVYSSAALLELVRSGLSREQAYALVQGAAADARRTGTAFADALVSAAKAAGHEVDAARLAEASRPEHFLARIGAVFERLERLDPDAAAEGPSAPC